MTTNNLIGFRDTLLKIAAKTKQPLIMERYTFAEVFSLARQLREQVNKAPVNSRRLLY